MDDIERYAVFEADFPDDSVEEGGNIVKPTGYSVMEAICRQLEATGIRVTAPEQHSFYGWTSDFKVGDVTICFVLQTAEIRTLIIVEPIAGWFTGNKIKSDALRRGIAILGSALQSEPRLHNLRWMTKVAFEASSRKKERN